MKNGGKNLFRAEEVFFYLYSCSKFSCLTLANQTDNSYDCTLSVPEIPVDYIPSWTYKTETVDGKINLSLAADARGDLWPCSSLAGLAPFRLGNLRDGLPAPERAFPALTPPVACQQCDRFSLCGGGCPAGRLEGRPAPLACAMQEVISEIMREEESQ